VYGLPTVVRFGCFEINTVSGELRKRGLRLKLNDQSFRVLTVLIAVPGQVVTREQLRKHIWPSDTFVDFETAINKAVSQLRSVLGDSSTNPRFVETLPNRGYRFIAPVHGQGDLGSSVSHELKSVAVLPFENGTGDAGHDLITDALADALINQLGASSQFRVISRTRQCVTNDLLRP
jgi:DNA-binding winged helix-turn-helix (wHTH) protein